MVVDTGESTLLLTARVSIHLPRSVDEWEIKYYSAFGKRLKNPDSKYLKNAGVVSMYDTFRPWYRNGGDLWLELSEGQYIWGLYMYQVWDTFEITYHKWNIPDVDWGV